jgi:hypothetical protein
MLLTLCCCSDDNSPSAVVEKACEGLLKDDYSVLSGSVYFPDSVEVKDAIGSRMALQKLMELTIRPIMSDTDSVSRLHLPELMEVLSESIDSSGAMVEVKVTAIDGDFSIVPVNLKQDAEGIWRIVNYNDLLPIVAIDSLNL